MNLDSPEFKAVMFASTVLHAQGRCREAVATVETELPKMLPECLPVAYLGIIWVREDLPCHRQRSTIQEAGNVGHRRLHHRVRGTWRRDGCGNAPPIVVRLGAFRFSN